MNTSNNDNNNDYSIHDKLEQIYEETDVDRKAEISNRIKYGDGLTKAILSVAFWGFWIFWLIVVLL